MTSEDDSLFREHTLTESEENEDELFDEENLTEEEQEFVRLYAVVQSNAYNLGVVNYNVANGEDEKAKEAAENTLKQSTNAMSAYFSMICVKKFEKASDDARDETIQNNINALATQESKKKLINEECSLKQNEIDKGKLDIKKIEDFLKEVRSKDKTST
jgi:alanine racemase